ncbi:STAS/SEC14 domain-containing protein [Tersicoccus sp. Bi-70]|uniref:DUF7793 family protein n=1 Tax=Tersicoccus sp. Bi-70 TaxID=1897634 RepID=UPI000977F473|nr:STAS/SEC14 domain-containing protein [Tersicoccus sp. Bi-70]OMH31158.1 hypothetical protein BGP79_08805 [Tersicoccus sp. Bi-70]
MTGGTGGTVPGPGSGIVSLTFDADGILHFVMEPHLRLDGVRAQNAVDLTNEWADGRRIAVLVDITGMISVDRDVRRVLTQPSAAAALAVLGGSSVERVLANFVISVTNVPCPIQYFRSEDQARAWLLQVTADEGR